MIFPGNHQFAPWYGPLDFRKYPQQRLDPLVGPPFAKGQNAGRIAAPGEIRVLRRGRKYAVGAEVDVAAMILLLAACADTPAATR